MAEQNLSQTQPSAGQFTNAIFREIYKNTWLKRLPTSNDSKKHKKERVWVVFCVHDDSEAFLETYADNKCAVLHKPEWFVSLNNTQHVSPTICAIEQDYEFVITLSQEVVRLAAPSWEAMLDWVESLRTKLHELKILNPKENLYSKLPESKPAILLPTRDPTSPLPPPPAVPPAILPGIEIVPTPAVVQATTVRQQSPTERSRTTNSDRSSNDLSVSANDCITSSTENVTVVPVNTSSSNIFTFENISSVLNTEVMMESQENSQSQLQNSYERLFHLQQSPGPSQIQSNNANASRDTVINQEPYLTLREHQVLQLQKEMKHPTGVRLLLRKKDCFNCIAFVDAFNSVWISGWKQRENPMLYNALHIGDQLLSIEGYTIKMVNDIQKILKASNSLYVHIIIKRVPRGQVFVIHREVEGQSLGIVQEGNTAVIASVQENGLAARHGLANRTKTCDDLSFTNWVLTEINGRPLNLFFKENQVKDRLNSVGRDISILVQPLDLIKQLKKQLKSYKNYKDYILQ